MRPPLAGEDRLLAWLRRRVDGALIGDDAAILEPRGPWAITVDSQVAGVHFPRGLGEARLARRLLAVNLSDLAAMGAEPRYAFLALTTPPDFGHRRFFRSLLAACRQSGVELAGGDLATAADRELVASLTLVGRRRPRGRWLRRGNARRGHSLWLGGTVGESAAGRWILAAGARWPDQRLHLPPQVATPAALGAAARRAVRRHLLPQPQLDLSRWLARQKAGGVIDVSDGVAKDLHRLCRESDVGAVVEADRLPLARHFAALSAALGRDPLALALGGGEDYVLLFSLPKTIQPPPEYGACWIGEVQSRGIELRRDGRLRSLAALGWDHLAAARPAQGASAAAPSG